jgi:hypothetical protein
LKELGPLERKAQPVDEADAALAAAGEKTITGPSSPVTIASTLTRSSGEIRPVTQPFAKPKRTKLWIAAGTGTLALVVSIVLLAGGSSKKPPPVAAAPPSAPPPKASTPATATATAPARAPAPKVVHVSVVGLEGGKLYLDGRHVGRVPMQLEIPKYTGHHEVTVRALGYLPFSEQVSSDEDGTVTARLRRPPPAQARSRPAPPADAVAKRPKVELKDPFER